MVSKKQQKDEDDYNTLKKELITYWFEDDGYGFSNLVDYLYKENNLCAFRPNLTETRYFMDTFTFNEMSKRDETNFKKRICNYLLRKEKEGELNKVFAQMRKDIIVYLFNKRVVNVADVLVECIDAKKGRIKIVYDLHNDIE